MPDSPRWWITPQFHLMWLSGASLVTLGVMWQDSISQCLSLRASSAILGSHSVPGFVKCVLTLLGGQGVNCIACTAISRLTWINMGLFSHGLWRFSWGVALKNAGSEESVLLQSYFIDLHYWRCAMLDENFPLQDLGMIYSKAVSRWGNITENGVF